VIVGGEVIEKVIPTDPADGDSGLARWNLIDIQRLAIAPAPAQTMGDPQPIWLNPFWQEARPGNGAPCRACKAVAIESGGGLLLPLLSPVANQFHHAGVRGVRDLHQHQQVVAAEAVRALPLALLGAVEALEGDVEPSSAFAFFPPDCRLDAADAYFLDCMDLSRYRSSTVFCAIVG
jgi:hypothetical protein